MLGTSKRGFQLVGFLSRVITGDEIRVYSKSPEIKKLTCQ
jgi:hypothetical protein